MAHRITLKEYMARPLSERLSQSKLAEAVGLTQGAVWQMLKGDRTVYVVEDDDGTISLEETRRLGNGTAA